MRLIAIAILAIVSVPVCAAEVVEVFTCKGKDGITVFQQYPCAVSSETLNRSTFERKPDAPYRGMTEAEYVAKNRRDRAAAQARSYPSTPLPRPAANKATAYDHSGTPSQRGSSAPPPSATDVPSAPSYVMDQYGTRYQRPPGSSFVINPNNGKPCLAVGGTIKCDI